MNIFRPLVIPLALFACASSTQASITINIGGGFLKNQGSTPVNYGSGLLLLVASTTDNTFNVPTNNSFVSGDDIELFRSTINGDGNSNGTNDPGEFLQPITLTLSGNFGQSDPLALYWFPTLTTSSASPGQGTNYGFYRSPAANLTTDADGSEAYFTPADGTTGYTLLFLTSDAGSAINTGSSGIPFGQAAFSVSPVPEPSTYFLLGPCLGSLTLGLVYRRRRMASALAN